MPAHRPGKLEPVRPLPSLAVPDGHRARPVADGDDLRWWYRREMSRRQVALCTQRIPRRPFVSLRNLPVTPELPIGATCLVICLFPSARDGACSVGPGSSDTLVVYAYAFSTRVPRRALDTILPALRLSLSRY